jgi:hypothetical protein
MTAYSDGPFVLYTMPFANEHSCRLESPDGYDRIRRENNWKQHDGKRIDALWGITGDSAELQAMRYPKDQWQTSDARRH